MFITGTPQFDFHFETKYHWCASSFCAQVGADPARPIILYSSGMVNYMPQEMVIVEGIADMVNKMTGYGSPQLLVTVYPKTAPMFDELKHQPADIIFQHVNWDQKWLTRFP